MTQLKMRGAPPMLWISALIAAAPAVFVIFEMTVKRAPLSSLLLVGSLAAAALPWLSRLAGRLTYRAAFDDIALHVGGEAIPWNTITRTKVLVGLRRELLVVERGSVATIVLVTRDLFAGHLEPMAELRKHLAAHRRDRGSIDRASS
jgi:hypothetical protein